MLIKQEFQCRLKLQSLKVLTIITGYKEELVTVKFDKIMQLENEIGQIMRDGPRESHSMTVAERHVGGFPSSH